MLIPVTGYLKARRFMPQPNIPGLNTIYFNITERCNLKCLHCWLGAEYSNTPSALGKELSVRELKEPIREAMELGLGSVKFTGGEPFLRKDILDFVNYFAELKLALSFETNATLLNEEIVRNLPRHAITDIAVSLDSSEAGSHDRLRGIEGSFLKASAGIKLLLKYNLPVQVIFSLYKDNLSKLWSAIDLLRVMGVGLIKINPLLSLGRAALLKEEEFLSIQELINLERRIEERHYPDIEVFLDLPLAFKSTRYFFNTRRNSRCAINHLLGILSDGTVSICGIGLGHTDLVMGNIRTDSLKYIWENSPVLKQLRCAIPEKLEGVCKRCILKNYCLGCCPADTYARNRSFTGAYQFCARAFEEGLFPETRLLKENAAIIA
jgi:SynChlorMet cassette radical SAM/SPASM protein ScmF